MYKIHVHLFVMPEALGSVIYVESRYDRTPKENILQVLPCKCVAHLLVTYAHQY